MIISGQKLRRWALRRLLAGTGIHLVEARVQCLDPEKLAYAAEQLGVPIRPVLV